MQVAAFACGAKRLITLAFRAPIKKGSSRNPGKHRNKNADLIDDVRASKHIYQTGVLMRDINTFLPFGRAFLSSTSSLMVTVSRSISHLTPPASLPVEGAKNPVQPLMSIANE
ncbi:hypothetical protein [Pseudomonas poae]|uniref:hypothetical protein n=1 Tax=Pseudomonas poae TaxID=200451 RepID=UPI0030DF5338